MPRDPLFETTVGKLPPQNIEAEEAVLGALMLYSKSIEEVRDTLRVETFYKEAHRKIFEAITSLRNDKEPIDIITVTDRLKKMDALDEVGGPYYISQLTNKVASSANLKFHCAVLEEKREKREWIRISNEIARLAYDETVDPEDCELMAAEGLKNIPSNLEATEGITIKEAFHEFIEQLNHIVNSDLKYIGIPTGFEEYDRDGGVMRDGNLLILAGRPGMGKTALMLAEIIFILVHLPEKHVHLFSLEMTAVEIASRIAAMMGLVDGGRIRDGRLDDKDWAQIHKVVGILEDSNLTIHDKVIPVSEITRIIRRKIAAGECDYAVIDYLQIVRAEKWQRGNNRETIVSHISRELKECAKNGKIPIKALSQLNRSVETRGGDKRPGLADLRESGAIEQDADRVEFVYRPEYYNLTEYENGQSTLGIGERIVAKNRGGSVGTYKMQWIETSALFRNLTPEYFKEEDPIAKARNEDDWSIDVEYDEDQGFPKKP